MIRKFSFILVALFTALQVQAQQDSLFTATLFGIKNDGSTDNTTAIQAAIDSLSSQGGGTLDFTVGRYLTGGITLRPHVNIHVGNGAVLVAVPNCHAFKSHDGQPALLYGCKVDSIKIYGNGVLEGSGNDIRAFVSDQLAKGYVNTDTCPALVCLDECNSCYMDELTLQNAAAPAIVARNCQALQAERLNIFDGGLRTTSILTAGCTATVLTQCYFDSQVKPLVNKAGKVPRLNNCHTPRGKY